MVTEFKIVIKTSLEDDQIMDTKIAKDLEIEIEVE